MKGRAIIPLVVGLAVGIIAVRSFVGILKKAQGRQAVATAQVVRASTNIGPAVEIDETMVEVAEVPRGLVPKQVFSEPQQVIGRVTSARIPQGFAVAPSFLAPEGTPPGMAARIRDGYRAVAVQVDEFVGVAGWIKPGSRVDIVVVMDIKCGSSKQTVSRILLQDIEVLAVGQQIESGDPTASLTRSVTLLVEPGNVPKLHLAATKGRLRLAMRNQGDSDAPRCQATTDNDLLDEQRNNRPASPGKRPSLLSRLFGKQAEKETDKTDKEFTVPTPMPVQVASAVHREWVVEVISGQRVYQMRFDSNRPDARLLSDGAARAAAQGRGGRSATARTAGKGRVSPAVGGTKNRAEQPAAEPDDAGAPGEAPEPRE